MPTNGLLARKLGMTTVFDESGSAIPVTVLEAGPCTVVQLRSQEQNGYQAAQIAFETLPPTTRRGGNVARGRPGHRGRSEVNKPLRGQYEKAGVEPHRHIAEFALDSGDELQVGATITVEMFQPGARVKVRGTSKGHGFQGVIKRWNFSGQGDSHGQKIHRKPASQGATDPARVFKGSKRPGRMGNRKVTVSNLVVVRVMPERNLLLIRGAVPGQAGGLVRVEKQ